MTAVFTRKKLDQLLDDLDLTLLILVGTADPAGPIHKCAEDNVTEEWRTTVLLEDTALLKKSEIAAWGLADQRFVSLGVNPEQERVNADAGTTAQMLRADGEPSILRIRQAFARGDAT